MAKIVRGDERGRPGKWIVDYRDSTGKRRWITKDTRAEANEALGDILNSFQSAPYCRVNPDITLAEYGDGVIDSRKAFVKESTAELNRRWFKRVRDRIGLLRVRDISPGTVVRLAEGLKGDGLSNGTVRYIIEVLSVILNRARLDGLIAHSPAHGIGRHVNLRSEKTEEVKAFTLEQRALFLEAARRSRFYALYRFLLGTGARLGEALALRVSDVSASTVVIDETYSNGRTTSPKSGRSRTVNVTKDVAADLRVQIARTIEAELAHGRQADHIFVSSSGRVHDHSVVWKDFNRVLRAAGLPLHFSPHSTRHTYATLLLSNGESIQYVQQQLGHSSIKLTVDVYGKWIPLKSGGVQERIECSHEEVARTAHSRS